MLMDFLISNIYAKHLDTSPNPTLFDQVKRVYRMVFHWLVHKKPAQLTVRPLICTNDVTVLLSMRVTEDTILRYMVNNVFFMTSIKFAQYIYIDRHWP